MTIPKHVDIRVPLLQLLTEHASLKVKEFEAPLAIWFGLNNVELSQRYDSGNTKIFYDRITWALSYLNMAGLVQKLKRGTYQITDIGREHLKSPEHINTYIEAHIKLRKPVKKRKTSKS